MECGVLQCSVQGSLFFLIYGNDMVRMSKDLGFSSLRMTPTSLQRGKTPLSYMGG